MKRREFLQSSGSVLASSAAGPLIYVPTARAQTPRELKFVLSWLVQSVDAPTFFARERGYFDKAGLKVTIDRGFGSADSVTKVGSGVYHIGEGDLYSMMEYNAKQTADKQLVAVAVKYQRSPLVIVSPKDKGIDHPFKLIGRTIGDVAGSATKRLFPVLARRVGFDESKVSWANVEARLREQLMARGQYDAVGAFSVSALPPLAKMGLPLDKLNVMYYTDYGLDLYGNGLITTRQLVREQPELVGGFVRAYVQGLRDTLADPATAMELATKTMRNDPGWDTDVERYRLQLTMDRLYTDPVERKSVGIGGVDMKRLETGIRQVAEGFAIPIVPPTDVFDGRFLQPLADRL